jgi:hypothetical protein
MKKRSTSSDLKKEQITNEDQINIINKEAPIQVERIKNIIVKPTI